MTRLGGAVLFVGRPAGRPAGRQSRRAAVTGPDQCTKYRGKEGRYRLRAGPGKRAGLSCGPGRGDFQGRKGRPGRLSSPYVSCAVARCHTGPPDGDAVNRPGPVLRIRGGPMSRPPVVCWTERAAGRAMRARAPASSPTRIDLGSTAGPGLSSTRTVTARQPRLRRGPLADIAPAGTLRPGACGVGAPRRHVGPGPGRGPIRSGRPAGRAGRRRKSLDRLRPVAGSVRPRK